MDFNSEPLTEWSRLWHTKGEFLGLGRQASPVFKWSEPAITRLTKAALDQLDQRQAVLRALLEHSRARFAPLGEPLDLEFGTHRWLKHDREEAYSDWLAWLLSQLKSGDIVDLFDVPELISDLDRAHLPLRVRREFYVAEGHEGASGRLDVIVEFRGNAALVLELKKGSIASSSTAKQRRYFQHMQETGKKCEYFLLVTDRYDEKVDSFIVMPYQKLCQKLRAWAAEMCNSANRRNLMLVAMVLAFVGAVETNLLRFTISDAGIPSDEVLEHLSALK